MPDFITHLLTNTPGGGDGKRRPTPSPTITGSRGVERCRSALRASIVDRMPLRAVEVLLDVAGSEHRLQVHLKRPFLVTRLLMQMKKDGKLNRDGSVKLVAAENGTIAKYDTVGTLPSFSFQRPPTLFEETVLIYIMTGGHRRLFLPDGYCSNRVRVELEYWEIPKEFWPKECLRDGEIRTFFHSPDENVKGRRGSLWGNFKKRAWRFFGYPTLSLWSTIFAIISILFVLVSISVLVMVSVPVVRENVAVSTYLDTVENVCVCWFTAEFLARLLVCPDRPIFLRNVMNIIDMLAIMPFFLELLLDNMGFDASTLDKVTGPILMIRLLRVARVMRVFKLARYSNSTKVVVETLVNAASELAMLGVVFGTAVMLFATTIYFLEKDSEETGFTSIPAAAWWAMSTMTTVGYGDMPIKSLGGKLVGTIASVCGVLCLGFPISLVVKKHPAGVRRVVII